jgi:hypothetical protein
MSTAISLSAREVLDLHADLQRSLAAMEPELREVLTGYGLSDAKQNLAWAASHLHPSVSLDDLDPWLASLGTDLFGATTYQVTAEMIDLAMALRETTPALDEILDEELPSPWGFMWLDRPIPMPSIYDDGRPPLMMHAVSWARVPGMPVAMDGRVRKLAAIRIRKWAYDDDPDGYPRPLHMIGQNMVPVAGRIRTGLTEHWLLHMIWILMGMEIVSSDPEQPDRHGRKRAANLRRQEIRVVRLRRPEHHEPAGDDRTVDWSCSWLVRGHWRKAPHGGTFRDGRRRTWVKPYIKGPDGLPLRATDILYRLSQ